MSKAIRKKDIAIVGISCKFPQSENPEAFWQNLMAGNELISFYSDEELEKFGLSQEVIKNPSFVKAKPVIDHPGSFDYSFFGYTKDEANCMDPQTRLLHEQVWLALEDASCDVSTYKKKVGLFVSASDNLNWIAHTMVNPSDKVNPYYASQLSNKNFAHTLISYGLNLTGPSYYINTACSSSLVAIHLACRNLLLKECSMALAGGVSLDSTKNKGHHYQEGMISSKDGHCKAFDKESTGTIGGDGAGVVVLKRLEDAIEDRDHIYAVIRSSAVNNDGKRKVGFTAPSVTGQSDCIKLAHRIANVTPDTISYIEAHGTGTKLGDPIEIEALNKAFNYDTDHQCAIGSVKTNMGHLDTAAGVAGFIKTSLAIKNRKIPPSLHFTNPNPEINFDGGPFEVNAQLKDWTPENKNLIRAGVSSFGIGGTNAHVVLEEAPEVEETTPSRPFQLLVYSAKTTSSLERYQNDLSEYLSTKEENDLADIAYTLKVGRKPFMYRNVVVSDTNEGALKRLKNKLPLYQANTKKNLVFMFSGQGSQYFQMAKDVYFQELDFKVFMDEGFQILNTITGEDYQRIVGYTNDETVDPLQINQTQYTQPLLFLIEYAFARLLMKWGATPKYMIGHSLGEYVAACISGVFSFEDALRILVKRASLMSEIEEGDMLGIGMPVSKITPFLNEALSVAAINTNNSCVVSGNQHAVAKFTEVLSQNDIPFTKLKTSHAFHSNMMEVMLDEYKEVLTKVSFSKPQFPFISNVTGKEILPEEATSPDYWVQHLRGTVYFADGIDFLLKKGDAICIEVGPGKTLSTFCKQSENFTKNSTVVGLLRHPKETKNDNQSLVEAIGNLWGSGVAIDWKAYYAAETRNKVAAPTYNFDTHTLDANVNPFEALANLEVRTSEKPISEWFYEPTWKKSRLLGDHQEVSDTKTYLVFMDDSGYGEITVQKLKEKGAQVIEVRQGNDFTKKSDTQFELNTSEYTDYEKLFLDLKEQNCALTNIIHLFTIDDKEAEKELGVYSLLHIAKCLQSFELTSVVDLSVVTRDVQVVLGNEETNPYTSMVLGLVPVITQENPSVKCTAIDISSQDDTTRSVENILQESTANVSDTCISYRLGTRWIKDYNPIQIEKSEPTNTKIKRGGVYLITGGLGDLGFTYSKYLLETYNASLILLGRTDVNKEEDEAKYTRLSELEKLGHVLYYKASINHLEEVQNAIEKGTSVFGDIHGVIHTAGVLTGTSFRSINFLKVEDCEKQFEPKVNGVEVLAEIFKDQTLDFCVLSSSLSSVLGGKEYASYASGNTFMDFFAQAGKIKNSVSINYDGLQLKESQQSAKGLNTTTVVDVLERVLSIDTMPQIVVSTTDLSARIAKWVAQTNEPSVVQTDTPLDITNEEFDRAYLTNEYVAPSTEIEKEISTLLEDFFGYTNIGVEDNFFELGGDSLKAMTLSNRLFKMFNIELTIEDFFDKPTIKALASEIEMAQKLIDAIQNNKKGKHKIEI
ncbi:polyketide synthase [Dokdonia pacifica]|uniref:Acyl transferase domain-containing protein n=1 Tax=Dokdonia pacifica TaxID=1627892 RepID=A0A239E5B1_9FLAO|nr:type I polyketide synthase [Dokdonia pacifica]GGG24215.1 polyketide synthase [Dokdonia pacifica]SNS39193.1 Acyl transferase domain-containing protein [Dokdonia pacifica]